MATLKRDPREDFSSTASPHVPDLGTSPSRISSLRPHQAARGTSVAEIRGSIAAQMGVCRGLISKPPASAWAVADDVSALVSAALSLCDQASELFEDDLDVESLDFDAAFGESPDAAHAPARDDVDSDVPAVAFAARADLRPLLRWLKGGPRIDLGAECARALRRVSKTLTALDVALAEATQSTSTLTPVANLAESLATRAHYARLRRAILCEPDASTVTRQSFERARIHMTLLVGSDVYAGLRANDRCQLDELHARVRGLLSAGTRPESDVARRLWQDLLGFARLIAEISRRHEIVESDTRIVVDAHEALRTLSEIPPRLRARLDMLAGLDDGVDRLLAEGAWRIEPWREVLSALHKRLAEPVTGRFLTVRAVRSGNALD